LLIVFFTFLTFYSAQFNKVTDCGCFGDAIPLTPWQSSAKDIILSVLIIYIFYRKKYLKPALKMVAGSISNWSGNAFSKAFTRLLCHRTPASDRLSDLIQGGRRHNAAMKPSADYIYKYIMQKDGETFEFDTYPI
jgi:hypothetical protein